MDEYELYTDRSSYDRTFPLGGKVKPKRPKRTREQRKQDRRDFLWDDVVPFLLKLVVIAGFLFLCGAGVMLATYSR